MSVRFLLRTLCAVSLLLAHGLPSQAAGFDGRCKAAPAIDLPDGANVIRVASEPALQQAMANLQDNTVLLLAPGEYRLSRTLWVNGRDNITIRGDSERCDAVSLIGRGMENASGRDAVPHGIWANGRGLQVHNLTIRDVYLHAISLDGNADAPRIYNVRMVDTGQQFIKANPLGFGSGVDNGRVEYAVMQYTNGPPKTDHGGGTGYTNGVDVHGGRNWLISHSHFENFHAPDSAASRWNPAILMWNGAADTVADSNTFVDVDRAIAFGLLDRSNDHRGGVIRNNMIALRADLFSAQRRQQADAMILVWSSPATRVLHNTVMTQGNTAKSIELRFDSSGAVVRNNLVSAPIGDRSGNSYTERDNVRYTGIDQFVDPGQADLHLKAPVTGVSAVAPRLSEAALDFDGEPRPTGAAVTVGADEVSADHARQAGTCRP